MADCDPYEPISGSPYYAVNDIGQKIQISETRTGPTSIRISWCIPPPPSGCSDDDSLYNGIVISYDTTPITRAKEPINGTVYISDPTADKLLHAGDKLDTALIVGAFYDDKVTTSLDITGLTPNAPVYISGFMVTREMLYHSAGVHTYSLPFGNEEDPSLPGFDIVEIGVDGITNPTTLVPTTTYTFKLTIDEKDPVTISVLGSDVIIPTTGYQVVDFNSLITNTNQTGLVPATTYTANVDVDTVANPISILGSTAQTFDDLITEINADLTGAVAVIDSGNIKITSSSTGTISKILITDTDLFSSITPIVFNAFITAVDGTVGDTYDNLIAEINRQIALIGNPQQSAGNPNTNAYYWNVTEQLLYQWDGSQHVLVDAIIEPTDPSTPTLNDYWYDTNDNKLYRWMGASWVLQNVIKFTQDPTNLDCDTFWFNGTQVYNWNGDIWCENNVYNQITDPSLPPTIDCPAYWYDSANEFIFEWNDTNNEWDDIDPIVWAIDPGTLPAGSYWFDTTNNLLKVLTIPPTWDTVTAAFIQVDEPTTPANLDLWYNPDLEELKQYDFATLAWLDVPVVVWRKDPLVRETCDIWWDTTADVLKVWDILTSTWVVASNFTQSAIDPSLPPALTKDDVWYDPSTGKLYWWDCSNFIEVPYINFPTDPTQPAINDVWHNTTTNEFFTWTTVWTPIVPTFSDEDPYAPLLGDLWFNTTINTLNQWSGVAWISILYSTVPFTPTNGDQYFNSITGLLMIWNGTAWVVATLTAVVFLDVDGNIRFESITLGSCSYIFVEDVDLFAALSPTATILLPVRGTDGVSDIPSYLELDIGDDGSSDERRELMEALRAQLGYPAINVELTKDQFDQAIDAGYEELRKRSGSAYRKQYYFITLNNNTQVYKMTDKKAGLDRIVEVMVINRNRAALNGTNNLWDQSFIQSLYHYGAYDLTSYHLLNEYIETIEHMFATGMQFSWNEYTRELTIHQRVGRSERVLIETMVERTQQEMLKDRTLKTWIESWALSECMFVLARIRGKFASLPGAGGGLSLNASDLYNEAVELKRDCLEQLSTQVIADKLDVGMVSDIFVG